MGRNRTIIKNTTMKTIMKKTLLSLCVLTLSSVTQAQNNIVYTYDANGNRIKRALKSAKSQTRSKLDTNAEITDGRLTVNIPHGTSLSDCTIALYDLSGNMIFSKRPSSHAEVVETKNLRAGVYIISIDIKGETESHKFVKR